jgi:hypothetical protein
VDRTNEIGIDPLNVVVYLESDSSLYHAANLCAFNFWRYELPIPGSEWRQGHESDDSIVHPDVVDQ